MKQIIIAGGGFGGLSAATTLAPALKDGHRITLIDSNSSFAMGLSKLWVLTGKRGPQEGRGDLRKLKERGIAFVQEDITAFDFDKKSVRTPSGTHPYDYLIIALGAETNPAHVPGLDPANDLYRFDNIPGLAAKLESLRTGNISVVICGARYKCPPAPFEACMLIESRLRETGRKSSVKVHVFIPDTLPMPAAGPIAGKKVIETLRDRGIEVHPGMKIKQIVGKKLVFESGDTFESDLVLAIPQHRPPQVIRESGLVDASGFIPVDPGTLMAQRAGVFAVGDVASIKLPGAGFLPKAGILAELQAAVVAKNILADLKGEPQSARFDGKGACFFETGDDTAMAVEGAFYSEGPDRVQMQAPSKEGYASKKQFEADRLQTWFP